MLLSIKASLPLPVGAHEHELNVDICCWNKPRQNRIGITYALGNFAETHTRSTQGNGNYENIN